MAKKKEQKRGHNFPVQEIVDHVEYEGNGLMILADTSDEAKKNVVSSFGAEAKGLFNEMEKSLELLAKKHDVKSTVKVFLILEH